jgi:hypothetical protein
MLKESCLLLCESFWRGDIFNKVLLKLKEIHEKINPSG